MHIYIYVTENKTRSACFKEHGTCTSSIISFVPQSLPRSCVCHTNDAGINDLDKFLVPVPVGSPIGLARFVPRSGIRLRFRYLPFHYSPFWFWRFTFLGDSFAKQFIHLLHVVLDRYWCAPSSGKFRCMFRGRYFVGYSLVRKPPSAAVPRRGGRRGRPT